MTNKKTSWSCPRDAAGIFILLHDAERDEMDDECVVCETADNLVEKFKSALDHGFKLGQDFTVVANVGIPGLTERLGTVYNETTT